MLQQERLCAIDYCVRITISYKSITTVCRRRPPPPEPADRRRRAAHASQPSGRRKRWVHTTTKLKWDDCLIPYEVNTSSGYSPDPDTVESLVREVEGLSGFRLVHYTAQEL